MQLGIIGLPQSGKTTIFNALTRGDQPITMNGGRFDIHTAIVNVCDMRVERLSELFRPQKTTFARVTFADIAGLDGTSTAETAKAGRPAGNGNGHNGFSGPMLNQLSQMDGFVHVVRCFENASIPHPMGTVDPLRDVEVVDSELILLDLITVERKLERLAEEKQKGNGRDKAFINSEIELFERLKSTLINARPLRDIEFTQEQEKTLSGYGFLTRKPVLLLFNLADGGQPPELEYAHRLSTIASMQGKLEMELTQLPVDEAQMFMREFGVKEMGLHRVIELSYELLGLQSFFTVGEDEVRAWTVQSGATAEAAAGVIHSDLQKGFIRADVICFQDLLDLGSLAAARSQGRLRLEGRDYRVQDGDVVHIRFNI